MEKGTSLRKEGGGDWLGGGGQVGGPPPTLPAPLPEQRGPQSLVEAGDAAAPQQVPGQLSGCGPGCSWRLHGGLGTPPARKLGLAR